MRFADLLGLSLSALWQQKLRIVLTWLGVVFGSLVLTTSLAVTQGVQQIILQQYHRMGELRLIEVFPQRYARDLKPPAEELKFPGKMSEEKRKRLQQEFTRRWQRQQAAQVQNTGISREVKEQIAGLEHVHSVQQLTHLWGVVSQGEQRHTVVTMGILADDMNFKDRLVCGQLFSPGNSQGAVISEYILYQFGVVDDEQVEQMIGKKLVVEFRIQSAPRYSLLSLFHLLGTGFEMTEQEGKILENIAARVPEAIAMLDLDAEEKFLVQKLLVEQAKKEPPKTLLREFTISGVLAVGENVSPRASWGWFAPVDLGIPARTAEEIFFQSQNVHKHGFDRLRVEVDDLAHVKTVNEQIKAMGLETYSLVDILEREQFMFLMIFSSMTIIALIALLVAALGITNTMLMSVLERVREIGIMKAVGARERHIQFIFLLEGGLIGLAGGLLGLLLGWAVSFPADSWAGSLVESRLNVKLEQSLFFFPWWLVLGVPLFAFLITTLAAYFPARRAARIDPVQALRHE